jgi:hypothetical protein
VLLRMRSPALSEPVPRPTLTPSRTEYNGFFERKKQVLQRSTL